jgi:hypothetical protein
LEDALQPTNSPQVREKAAKVHQKLTQLMEETKGIGFMEGAKGTEHVEEKKGRSADHDDDGGARSGAGTGAVLALSPRPTHPPQFAPITCPYQKLCTAFFASLNLNSKWVWDW